MRAYLAGVVAALILASLPGAPQADETAKPSAAADEYVAEAKSRILLRLPAGRRPSFTDVRRYEVEDSIAVCGQVRVGDEGVPFVVMWDREDALDQAIVMAPLLRGETPGERPQLAFVAEGIEELCKGAAVRHETPPSSSPRPPNISDEQYLVAAQAGVAARIAGVPGSTVGAGRIGRNPQGRIVVCGAAEVRRLRLPYATVWDADERLDRGASMIAVLGETTPAEKPELDAFSRTVRMLCEPAGLGGALPPAPG